MRMTTGLALGALLVGCAATPPPAPPRQAPPESEVPFAGGLRAERPVFRVGEPPASEVGPEAAGTLEAVRELQERGDVPPEAQEAVWCALAAVHERNPELSRAQGACAAWREYLSTLERLRATVAGDVERLRGQAGSREARLRAVEGFLRAYAPLRATPHGKVGLAVREALLAGRLAELEAGVILRREERSGLTRVWQPAPPPVESAPPAHTGFWRDREEVTVRAWRACVRAGACGVPAEGVGCTWTPEARPEDALAVTCVTREQAEAFCAWTDGRLPTLLEWRSAGLPEEGFARQPGRGLRCVE